MYKQLNVMLPAPQKSHTLTQKLQMLILVLNNLVTNTRTAKNHVIQSPVRYEQSVAGRLSVSCRFPSLCRSLVVGRAPLVMVVAVVGFPLASLPSERRSFARTVDC